MEKYCNTCKIHNICPAIKALSETVSLVLDTNSYNKLESLLFEECMYKAEKAENKDKNS